MPTREPHMSYARRIATTLAIATVAMTAAGLAPAPMMPQLSGSTVPVAPNAGMPAGATVAPSGGERISILYETDPAVRAILGGSESMRTLPWLFRQEPSNSGPGAQLASNGQRMTKISGAALFKKPTAEAMTAMLKTAVDRTCVTPAGVNTCGAHRVGVDEIGTEWGATAAAGGKPTPSGRLRATMKSLEAMPYPGGGTYAARVHFYVAPGVSTAIATGLGFNRTEGRDGKDHFRNYAGLMPALRRAGGVWLEMYHYPKGTLKRTPFDAAEWSTVPARFASFMRDRGGSATAPPNSLLHFVMTGDDIPTQWKRATNGGLNTMILSNGPASFKLTGADAVAYGTKFREFFALG